MLRMVKRRNVLLFAMAFPATGPGRAGRPRSWYQGAPRRHHFDGISRSLRVSDAWGEERRRTGKCHGTGCVRHRTVPAGIGRKQPPVLEAEQHRAVAHDGLASLNGREAADPYHRDPGSVCHLPTPPVRFGHDRSGCAQTPRGWNPISRRRSPGFISPDTAGSPLMVRRVRRTSRSPGIGAEPANSSPITGTANLARCRDIWYVAVILPTRPDIPAECTRCGLSSTSDTFRAGIA